MDFIFILLGLILICLVLQFFTKNASPNISSPGFKRFKAVYLVVYFLAAGGDWLQGPHVYMLYETYSMSKHDIEYLFLAGFGSSLLFGTIIGSFADKYGRKCNCILYGVLYSLACITKHFPNFWILFVGRLLAGIATSILFSAFESWIVSENHKEGFSDEGLVNLFSSATLGNSIVAIIAGVLAQFVADFFGFVAPFDLSLCVLCVMCIVIALTWSENYGDVTPNFKKQYSEAISVICKDRSVLLLGLVQGLFEGAMYTFVLEWTPTLTFAFQEGQSNSVLPHGYIFASFMVCVMIGSGIFSVLNKHLREEDYMRGVLLLSAISLVIPIIFPKEAPLVFGGFLMFEICVGIFWPAMATMRSYHLPDQNRATVMNLFRLLLNFLVIIVLLADMERRSIFIVCSVMISVAFLCQCALSRLKAGPSRVVALSVSSEV